VQTITVLIRQVGEGQAGAKEELFACTEKARPLLMQSLRI
jgi:hypothetical protein